MYLFNEKGKAVEVYEMTPQEELIAAYRKKELEGKIPVEERFYYAKTNYDRMLIEDRDTFNMEGLNYEGTLPPRFFKVLHFFGRQLFFSQDNTQITKSYINGDYDDKKAIRIIDKEDKYFVLPENDYSYHQYADEYWMTNIIQIPESLYLLHLLNQGNFSAVVSENIDEQVGLFKVGQDPIYAIDMLMLDQSYKTGLISDTTDEMMDKIEVTEQILKRVRKSQGSR